MTKLCKYILIATIVTSTFTVHATEPIRMFCIGNSIVAGGFPDENLYHLLGTSYSVYCAGSSHATALRNTNVNIWTKGPWNGLWKFKPHVVTVMLGTNDTKPQNWGTYGKNFEKDYGDLLDSIASFPSHPEVIPVLPPPIFKNNMDIHGDVLADEIIPIIKKVAAQKGVRLMDAHTPLLKHGKVFRDGVHPSQGAGNDSLAAVYYRDLAEKSTRIACVTDFAPEIMDTKNNKVLPDSQSYTVQLGRLLGWGHMVHNFGISGACVQKNVSTPFWSKERMSRIAAWKPHKIVIMLGTYDAKSQNWNRTNFNKDMGELVNEFSKIDPSPDIWLVLPTPVVKSTDGISGTTISDEIVPAIKDVAVEKGLSIIDAHTPFKKMEKLLSNGVHPNAEGQDSLARILYRAISQKTSTVTDYSSVLHNRNSNVLFRIKQKKLSIQLNMLKSGEVSIFTVNGKKVQFKKIIPDQNKSCVELPLDGLGRGIYLVRVKQDIFEYAETISIM